MEIKITDKKLLINLVSIQSTTRNDDAINSFIEEQLKAIDGVTVSKDAFGNIYAVKGSGDNGYKCIVSHTDTVHSFEKGRLVYLHGDNLFAMAENSPATTNSYYKNESLIKQVGIGGDDRAGIYTCILAMREFDNIKSVFFRFEETGMNGSSNANMDFFEDCNFVVQCDRKGSTDFITHTNGVKTASTEFENELMPIYKKYGYSVTSGIATDVGQLKKNGLKVCAINLSSGYHDAHTDRETINITQLENCYSLVREIFVEKGDIRFEHKYVPVVSSFAWPTVSNKYDKKRDSLKNILHNNVFTNSMPITDFIELEFSHTDFSMTEIANSGLFQMNIPNVYEVSGDFCPHCNKSDGVIFATDAMEFYCANPECWKNIEDGAMFKNAVIEHDGNEYCYDRINNVWILRENALWDKHTESYHQIV